MALTHSWSSSGLKHYFLNMNNQINISSHLHNNNVLVVTKLYLDIFTVKPGQAFCPRIKIWFCCSKFEFILRSNFSSSNRVTDFSSQASI